MTFGANNQLFPRVVAGAFCRAARICGRLRSSRNPGDDPASLGTVCSGARRIPSAKSFSHLSLLIGSLRSPCACLRVNALFWFFEGLSLWTCTQSNVIQFRRKSPSCESSPLNFVSFIVSPSNIGAALNFKGNAPLSAAGQPPRQSTLRGRAGD